MLFDGIKGDMSRLDNRDRFSVVVASRQLLRPLGLDPLGPTVAVECKAPCPFKENKGSGQENWTYLPGKAGYDYMPAAWYAQCQVTMLACQREKCWLLEYLPEKTKMYIVHANHAWQDDMLDLLKKLVHQRGCDLSSSQEQGWLSFLKLTKENCRDIEPEWERRSKSGVGGSRWMSPQ